MDFSLDIDGDNFTADLVHVFTISRLVVELVRPLVLREKKWSRWLWAWEQKDPSALGIPIRIIAHGTEQEGASYKRTRKAVVFNFLPGASRRIYTCRMNDVIAHEIGHAILDSICPLLYADDSSTASSTREQEALRDRIASHRGADSLHEAFADAMWLCFALSREEWCSEILSECGGDLGRPSRATEIGHAMEHTDPEITGGVGNGVRSALNDKSSTNCGKGVYGSSEVFVGFMWDIVRGLFELTGGIATLGLQAAATSLCGIAGLLLKVLVVALCRASPPLPTFAETYALMKDDGIIAECTSEIPAAALWHKVSVVQEVVSSCGVQRGIEYLCLSRRQQRSSLFGDY